MSHVKKSLESAYVKRFSCKSFKKSVCSASILIDYLSSKIFFSKKKKNLLQFKKNIKRYENNTSSPSFCDSAFLG